MGELGAKQISNSIYYSEDINSLHIKPYKAKIFTVPNSYIFDDGTIVILYGYYNGGDTFSAGYTLGFYAGYMDTNLYVTSGVITNPLFGDIPLVFPNDIHIMVTSVSEIESKLDNNTLNFDNLKVNSLSSEFSELLNKNYFISPSSIIIEPDYSSNTINIVFSAVNVAHSQDLIPITHNSNNTGKYTFLFGKLVYDIKSNSFLNVEKLSFSGYNYGPPGAMEGYNNPILVKFGDTYRLFYGTLTDFVEINGYHTTDSYKGYLYVDASFSKKSHSFGSSMPKYNNNVVYTSGILYDEKRKSLIIPGFELNSRYNSNSLSDIPPQPLYMYEVNPITFDVTNKSSNNIDIDMGILSMDSPMPDWKGKTLIALNRLIFTSFSEICDRKTLFAITVINNVFTTNFAALFDLDSFSFVENSFVDVTPFCKAANNFGPNYLYSTISSDGKFILISKSYHYGG